jgi:hypothetical protein
MIKAMSIFAPIIAMLCLGFLREALGGRGRSMHKANVAISIAKLALKIMRTTANVRFCAIKETLNAKSGLLPEAACILFSQPMISLPMQARKRQTRI